MAIYSGTNTFWQAKRGIVQNGLVLNLDAGVSESYNGGTVWRDLSGHGNNGTLLNGVGFDSANGGSLVFDGTNDKVITTDISNIFSFTYEIICKKPTSTGYLIYRNDNMNYTGNEDNGDVFITGTGDLTFHVEYASTDNDKFITASRVINADRFYNITASYNYTTKVQTLYLDGLLVGTLDNSSEPSNLYRNNKFYSIGVQGYSNHNGQSIDRNFFNSNISVVKIYNRALSAQEILQNFNATRKRFGL